MTTTKINQKEYLKKYLSSNVGDEKKKKKKKSKSKTTVKIIDDDIDLSKIEANEDDMDIFQTGEDAPQIVGVIDDRPPELQALDYQNSNKWKAVNNDNFTNMLNVAKPSSSKIRLTNESSPPMKIKKKKDSYNNDEFSTDRRKDNSKFKDLSPRRKSSKTNYTPKHKNLLDDISTKRQKAQKYNDDDLSPDRYKNRKDSEDLSPRRIKTVRRSKDLSPKRYKNRRGGSDEDLSPKRSRNRTNYDNDVSPKRSKHRQSDLSPKRYKSRPDSDRDSSPKQSRTKKTSDDDISPTRFQNRDYSPKRSTKSRFDTPYQRKSTSRENSPKRRTTPDNKNQLTSLRDYSPKRRKMSRFDAPYQRRSTSRENSPQCRSPQNNKNQPSTSRNRRGKSTSLDLSPPRTSTNKIKERHNKGRDNYSRYSPSPPQHIKIKRDESPPPTHSKMMAKTLDGKTAGLSDANALHDENAKFKEHEQTLFSKMTDEMSGRNADVVMRDRSTGKRRNFAQESEKQRKIDENEKAKKAIYDRWGAGLKQVEEHKARLDEISHEMNKPLARYSNDEDLDDYLKKQERDGDPMLEYIRQKEREKNKKQGVPEMPKYDGSFPDNRFNIRPGYRWDGVDRSNGFEKKWFETISKKKAVEEEAYRYSTEDM